MIWDKENINNIVKYINNELIKNRTMKSIEIEDFKENERVIHKRLLRLGYKKVNNQYITGNITPLKENKKQTIGTIKNKNNTNKPVNMLKENTDAIIDNSNDYKLQLLLDNIDSLLKLIPSNITSNTENLRSGVNDVKSFRIDTGLYSAVKERATKNNTNISDILNKAIEDYLNNYI